MSSPCSLFEETCSTENLFQAWYDFRRGKMSRRDVLEFEYHLEPRIFELQRRLLKGSYRHGEYSTLHLCDPKPRLIRRASVLDRIVHQTVYTQLVREFDRRFIHDVYSGRSGKGVHAGVSAVERMVWKVSRNYTRPCYYLKADIAKFYDSIDQAILLQAFTRRVVDTRMADLIQEIVCSFHTPGQEGKGIPIGNLTSQIFTNIYLNGFDHWMKHVLKARYYARFSDDFVVLSENKDWLWSIREQISCFFESLKLRLHPTKVIVAPVHRGLDFLGYVLLPHYRRVRARTIKRMFALMNAKMDRCLAGALDVESYQQSIQSYIGLLGHADTYHLQIKFQNICSVTIR